MKKTLLVAAAVVITSISSFAQGNVLIAGLTRGVWDNFSAANPKLAADMKVSILFGTGTPLIAGIAGSGFNTAGNGGVYVPTNAIPLGTSFSIATAWTDILSDPSFHLMDGTNAVVGPLVASPGANGSIVYNAATAFLSLNVNGGTAYNMYLVGWDGAFATAALAQAAGAAVGWSQYFSYTPATGINTPQTFSGLAGSFGVFTPVPEPGTMALAALGGASLLLFRRKK